MVFVAIQVPVQQQALDHGIGLDDGPGIVARARHQHFDGALLQFQCDAAHGAAGRGGVVIVFMHQQALHAQPPGKS